MISITIMQGSMETNKRMEALMKFKARAEKSNKARAERNLMQIKGSNLPVVERLKKMAERQGKELKVQPIKIDAEKAQKFMNRLKKKEK